MARGYIKYEVWVAVDVDDFVPPEGVERTSLAWEDAYEAWYDNALDTVFEYNYAQQILDLGPHVLNVTLNDYDLDEY